MKKDGFLVERLVNFIASRETLLEDGQKTMILSINEHKAIIEYILLMREAFLKSKKLKESITYTLESVLVNKRMTLKGNVQCYLVDSQITNLLQTLALDSITKDADCLKYWNKVIKDSSKALLLPLKTDFVDLDSTCLFGNSYKTIQNSWFSNKVIKHQNKNSLKIFLQFYKFLLVDGMERDVIQLRTRKIRLKLTSIQKRTLKKWSDDSRYSYNKAIGLMAPESIGEEYNGTKPEFVNTTYSKLELRNLITPVSVCCFTEWLLETPKSIRESAVFEAHKNLRSCFTNLKNGNIKYFNLGFMSKRKQSWSIGVTKDAVKPYGKSIGIYEASTGMRFKLTEPIYEVNHDIKIQFDGLHYYLCVPYAKELKINNKFWFTSLDPGVRKFQTTYSPDANEHLIIGDRASTRLYSCLLSLDKMISNHVPSKKILKLRKKIQNLQSEMHFKTVNFLTDRYQNIYVPKLTKCNDIISKEYRKIRTKTVRNMVVLAHCKFIERLKTKAEEFTNVTVKVITEEFTSQKCLNCRENTKTSSEVYVCNNCNFTIDRDILGSSNILVKNW
jgi:putative transposase